MASYLTVAGRARAGFEVQGSRFVGYAAPVRSVEEAEAFLTAVEADHQDATHVVPAYRVRVDPLRAWSSDAGEPAGSAGKPVLTVLERRGVENVVVAVVRYFGGTKLGIGGLARAYARAAGEAIDAAGVLEHSPHERILIDVEYGDSGTVRGILESEGVEFEATYGERVSFQAWVASTVMDRLCDRMLSATSGRARIQQS